MAASLTFTSNSFAYATQFSSATSINTEYDVLTVDNTYDRRVYGLSCTSTDTGAQTVKIYIHDGTTSYQIYTINIPLSSGNTTSAAAVDIFGSSLGASAFQKQRDANGVPYFNLPAGWKITASYGTALTGAEVLNFISFGETYGA